jgi:HlyD family secretion protein
VAKAQVAVAESQVAVTKTEIERAMVRAPVEGRIIQVNVRPGEFATAATGQTLMVLQAPRGLHVRVDIDERDIPRFSPGTPAEGFARGDAAHPVPLRFVRVEPYVIPKTSLTGETTELVDTRVLQAIYDVADPKSHLYVGQQMDVFIEKAGPLHTT